MSVSHSKQPPSSQDKLLTCVLCATDFVNAQLLKLHKTSTRPATCDLPNCGKAFANVCKLQRHKRMEKHSSMKQPRNEPRKENINISTKQAHSTKSVIVSSGPKVQKVSSPAVQSW